jgi:hypothetical protein
MIKRLVFFLVIAWIGLFVVIPAAAFPTLPSSFYGTVKVNGENLPDGTAVQALIGHLVVVEGQTQTYEGGSVFAINVPGDDPATAHQDGGREGDTIYFKVGDVLAEQMGTWHSGTNVELDLTAVFAEPTDTPQASPTSPARLSQSTPLSTEVADELLRVTPVTGQPSPSTPQSLADDGKRFTNMIQTGLIVLLALSGTGFAFWYFRKR